MITGKNYIGNEHSTLGGKAFTTFDPKLNLETEWTFYEATPAEVSKAVDLAWTAFLEFRELSGSRKASFLR